MSRSQRRPGRRRPSLVALAALPLVLAGCGSSLSAEAGSGGSDELKVGLALPASGVYEPLGVDMTNGFQLYLDQHDGQLGGKDVEVVHADTGEGPDTGVPAVTKLVTQDQVSSVVGIVNSATALGVKDVVTESKVPLIVANAGASDLADGSPYIWRTSFTNTAIGASLGKRVAEEVENGSVYVMAADYAAGEEYAGGFVEAFEEAGGEVAGTSMTPFGTTTDWQPFLSKAKNSGASAIYAFYAGSEAVNFVKQYNSFGIAKDMPLYGPGFLTEGGVLAAQGKAAAGVRTSLHYSDQIDTPENQEFVSAYQEAYDAAPTVYAVQAYDAAAALDLALAETDATDGEAIAEALEGVDEVPSPRGAWSFDDDHNPDQPYFLREVAAQDDGFVNTVLEPLE